MRRVLVIGCSGAGKSTFARRLAQQSGLPLIHLDALYWRRGWVEPTQEVWDAKIDRLLEGDCWIMDGNYGRTLERRIAACDTVLFLDRSRWLCLWRVLKRRIAYRGRSRPDMAEGCEERLSLQLLWWVLGYTSRRRPGILRQLMTLRAPQRAVVLKDEKSIDGFLNNLVDSGQSDKVTASSARR